MQTKITKYQDARVIKALWLFGQQQIYDDDHSIILLLSNIIVKYKGKAIEDRITYEKNL